MVDLSEGTGSAPGRHGPTSNGRLWLCPARISCVCIGAVEPRPLADFPRAFSLVNPGLRGCWTLQCGAVRVTARPGRLGTR